MGVASFFRREKPQGAGHFVHPDSSGPEQTSSLVSLRDPDAGRVRATPRRTPPGPPRQAVGPPPAGWPGRRMRPGAEGTRGWRDPSAGETAQPLVAPQPGRVLRPGHPEKVTV